MSLKERLEKGQSTIAGEPAIWSLLSLNRKSAFLRVEKADGQRHYVMWSGLSDMDYGASDAGQWECLHLYFMNRNIVVQGRNLDTIIQKIEEDSHMMMALRELPREILPRALAKQGIVVITSIEIRSREAEATCSGSDQTGMPDSGEATA
ncbi:hypothetical protein OpiT1DRAFT_05927 [Opitutaceae bacterium TAV1]|nr:hypothetical protein OpiT1DRAFT_05927 [Opitutaceae bacterium TAV1]